MLSGKYEELAMRSQANQTAIGDRLTALDGKSQRQLTQLRNGVTGLSDEVGELNACVKKFVEYGQPLDITNIQEEVGDCLWRLTQICQAIGYTLEQAMIHNIQKLQIRYPEGFNDFQAAEENRDRAAERQLLEIDPHTCAGTNQPGGIQLFQTGQGWAEPPEIKHFTCLHNGCNSWSSYTIQDVILHNSKKFILCPVCNWLSMVEEGIPVELPQAEPEIVASYGDGLVRELLDSSYNCLCNQCHKNKVHHTNSLGICPNCAAEIRSGRRVLITKE